MISDFVIFILQSRESKGGAVECEESRLAEQWLLFPSFLVEFCF